MSATSCDISQTNPPTTSTTGPRQTVDPLPNFAQHFLQSVAESGSCNGTKVERKGCCSQSSCGSHFRDSSQLQSSLIQSNSRGMLSGMSVLLKTDTVQTDLLNRACFGRPRITTENNEQWFQLCMEEAFYLYHPLNCIKIVNHNDCEQNSDELWKYMTTKRENFLVLYKAYSHLRSKNWVVRLGSQYGMDFVAYRHHPALVHSEYAVLVLSAQDGNANGRLKVWSDFQCTLRLCGSVVKMLLVLNIVEQKKHAASPSCLDSYGVEERTVTRWSPEKCRDKTNLNLAQLNIRLTDTI